MLTFILFSIGVVAALFALRLIPAHWIGASVWMGMVSLMLLATWAIGRRADAQTQRRLVMGLTTLLVALALTGRQIIRLFSW